MNKNKLVNRFIIGTFVMLYLLVSIISTIHVIDFFELSNPKWLAVSLAIGFELGAAASLAALITLDKMNKTLVWALFITITGMQMQGNMYYAFINLQDYNGWVELFNLVEWEPLAQKRLLAAVSGAILPLVALGFIKSLVDYIKPESEVGELSQNNLEEVVSDINTPEKKTNEEIVVEDNFEDLDITMSDGLDDLSEDDIAIMSEAIQEFSEPNQDLKDAVVEIKEKKVGLTEQVKEARTVTPNKRITQPDNGLNELVVRTSKTQPGED